MDRLEHIFELQERFDRDLARRRRLPEYSPAEWVQKEVLAMVAELGELLDEVNFKWWKNPHPLDHEAIKGELVDILHFLVSMCLKTGITAEEFYQGYLAKNQENFRRQEGLTDQQEYVAVARDREE
ncbi:dUTPase [Moorella sp. Hama-1]|uniref:dUTPase n=1 Tax=Moorella sp. Hama-1 TaxID=2138101 RepID=UPI001379E27C|nr:dUTPase [Moorella sp. Hama-1]MDN5361617.1 hypothetical protein [Moorella sp. (in: firmicutes)]BCV21145.1 dUTPase [Moorella sp. Hama-1]